MKLLQVLATAQVQSVSSMNLNAVATIETCGMNLKPWFNISKTNTSKIFLRIYTENLVRKTQIPSTLARPPWQTE